MFPISCPVFWQVQVPQIAALIQQVIRIYRLFCFFIREVNSSKINESVVWIFCLVFVCVARVYMRAASCGEAEGNCTIVSVCVDTSFLPPATPTLQLKRMYNNRKGCFFYTYFEGLCFVILVDLYHCITNMQALFTWGSRKQFILRFFSSSNYLDSF